MNVREDLINEFELNQSLAELATIFSNNSNVLILKSYTQYTIASVQIKASGLYLILSPYIIENTTLSYYYEFELFKNEVSLVCDSGYFPVGAGFNKSGHLSHVLHLTEGEFINIKCRTNVVDQQNGLNTYATIYAIRIK